MNVDFTFSDTVAGYVSSYNSRESCFTLRTSDDREFAVYLNSNTFARYAYNLSESYQDATGDMPRLLALPTSLSSLTALSTRQAKRDGSKRSGWYSRVMDPGHTATRSRVGGSTSRVRLVSLI